MKKIYTAVATVILGYSLVLPHGLNSEEQPPKAQDDIEQLISDHTEFMFSLYPVLEEENKNLIFSPYSIAECLSMVLIGARGNTESQMQTALHLDVDRKNLPKISGQLTQSLLPRSDVKIPFELNIANAIWVDQGTFLLADFRYAIEHSFKAKLFMLNFSQPENAVAKMNQWVSDQTKDKIEQLLTGQDINEMTRLVLTNAVYFQGTWVHSFDPKMTKKKKFYPVPEISSDVEMMKNTALFPYYENDLLQAVALPFNGKTNSNSSLTCFILLPKSSNNFSEIVQELPVSFNKWLGDTEHKKVSLQLPKFSLSNRYDLNSPLQKLGIEDAFSSEANFTGIDGMRDLFLNKVIAQVFFSLDENGVVAAAATAASMNVTSAPSQEPPISFIADHPFLFFIVDINSHEVLFVGKFTNPSPP